MVVLGFIVEGFSEKIVLEKSDLFAYLDSLGVNYIPEIINSEGNGNLLPRHLEKHTKVLKDKGANKILILTDLDEDECITLTKSRISAPADHIVIVSVRKLEAWYLADTALMRKILNDADFTAPEIETLAEPLSVIRSLVVSKTGRGISPLKTVIANRMVSNGFSILNAAQHPNCHSAKYFIQKITSLAS